MAEDASKTPEPFDVQTVTQLARLMSRHDLSEIDLRRGDWSIRLRRGRAEPSAGRLPPAPVTAEVASTPAPVAPAKAEPAPKKQLLIEIKSPTVGTFYAQEKPGSPPFVTVGSRVTPSTVVCLIEAMKIYNEVTADCTGVVAEILVTDKQPVEFGTVLFRVDPTG